MGGNSAVAQRDGGAVVCVEEGRGVRKRSTAAVGGGRTPRRPSHSALDRSPFRPTHCPDAVLYHPAACTHLSAPDTRTRLSSHAPAPGLQPHAPHDDTQSESKAPNTLVERGASAHLYRLHSPAATVRILTFRK